MLAADGGFSLIGYTTSPVADGAVSQPGRGGADLWLVRTDAAGNRLWDRRYGGDGEEQPFGAQRTPDGGVLILTETSSTVSGEVTQPSRGKVDGWLLRLDAAGAVVYDRRLGGSEEDRLTGLVQGPGHRLVVGGSTKSPISGDLSAAPDGEQDMLLLFLDDLSDGGQPTRTLTFGAAAAGPLTTTVTVEQNGFECYHGTATSHQATGLNKAQTASVIIEPAAPTSAQ